MKTFKIPFTACLLHVYCVTILAQMPNDPFHPMLQEGKKWKTENVWEWLPTIEYDHYIEGDTLIGGKLWKKVYSNMHGGDYEYFAAITEEGRKVYAIASGKDRIRLLYDFSLQVGAKVGCTSESYGSFDCLVESDEEMRFQSMELKSIDTIKVRGLELRRFIFESYYVDKSATRSTSFSYPSLVWVEGIGSEGGLFSSWRKASPESRVSCYVDEEVVFTADDFHIANEPDGIWDKTDTKANADRSFIYTLQGIKTDTPSKGIHIIRYSDGTTKKVYTR